jgi:hypothetical protein
MEKVARKKRVQKQERQVASHAHKWQPRKIVVAQIGRNGGLEGESLGKSKVVIGRRGASRRNSPARGGAAGRPFPCPWGLSGNDETK